MISSVSNSAYTSAASTVATSTEAKSSSEAKATTDDTAAVYEKSDSAKNQATTKQQNVTKKDNSSIVAQLKADQEARLSSLQSLVEKLITKQGQSFAWANSSNEDLMNNSEFWNSIREGKFEVDEETAAQAREDISEDGYWGVKQTSDRLVDFAKALTGGDASKIENMRDAIKKGFKAAEKLWGGELPEISQKTYDATMEKLDQWAKESGIQ